MTPARYATTFVAFLGCFVSATVAMAGFRADDPLQIQRWTVNFGFGKLVTVSGSLGSVRQTDGYHNLKGEWVNGSGNQLGCQITVRRHVYAAGWTYENVVDCWAWSEDWAKNDGDGNGWLSCTTTEPAFINAVASMTSDSNVRFVLEDDETEENPYYAQFNERIGFGRCIDVRVANASFTPPKDR